MFRGRPESTARPSPSPTAIALVLFGMTVLAAASAAGLLADIQTDLSEAAGEMESGTQDETGGDLPSSWSRPPHATEPLGP